MNNPKRKNNLAFNKLNTSTIIIDFNAEKQFHQTNELGGFIWDLCDGKNSFEQIVDCIEQEFDMDKQIIENDLKEFLTLLKQNELLDY